MSDEEISSVGKIAYLTEVERDGIISCLNRRNGVFQDPQCDLALASLGVDRIWVEQALSYPAVYYADPTRRREFEAAMRILTDALSRAESRQRNCCVD